MTASVIEMYTDENIAMHSILPFSECEHPAVYANILTKCYQMSLYSKDYSDVFTYLISQLTHLTKSKYAGISVLQKNGNDSFLEFVPKSNPACNMRIKTNHDLTKDNILSRAVSGNVIIMSNNVSTDPRIFQFPEEHIVLTKLLVIPLLVDEVCIGVILLGNKKETYSEEDVYRIYPIIEVCNSTILSMNRKTQYSITDLLKSKHDIQKTKDDFLATMSHEIRTPLTGIMGAVTLLPQSGPLNQKQTEHLKIATTCCTQLLELINSILDFSRLSSNTLTLGRESFDLRSCIETSIMVIKARADSKGLKIITNIEEFPKLLIGDPLRLKQILVNLLTNAVKFTESGTITLSAVVTRKYVDNDLFWNVNFKISDTGIGIVHADKSKLFKIFTQLSHQTAYNKQDGAGLGLAISKELVELMGGTITVFSDGPGKGSTFSFDIVLEEDVNIEEILGKHERLIKDIKVLNVDDKNENLLILDEMLYRWNISSIMCNDAQKAIRYVERGQKFDVIIIDIFMPYMSGIELAQQLRESYPSVPLIGISSVEGFEDQAKQLFDVYLKKPYNPTKILKSLIQVLTKDKIFESPSPSKNKERKITKDKLKIIVAEDDPSSRFMIKEMLTLLGYTEVVLVENGYECVERLKVEKFDVCLMDIKMPVMDGIEASKYIRTLKNRPSVIAVSAGVMDADKGSCLKAGMDGYLSKPFSTKDLDTVLARYVC